ncbi:MAG: alpha/beta hydrolase-fold protein [Candidatus Eremiobacteraeota bacterium]|nr:alpha/beta hydrolase-fold protein [Candidatus Eremiobacteraeota bacterium]
MEIKGSSFHSPAPLPKVIEGSSDGEGLCIRQDSVSLGAESPDGSAPSFLKKAAGIPATGGTYTGDVRIFNDFHSEILGNDRNVYVYLPPGYEQHPGKKYPVLYMADGQNVFNSGTAFGGVEWGVDETAERLIREGALKDVIIVAVSNTKDRMSEYTPVPDPVHGGGKLPQYARFLTEELKPFIDSTFRTSLKPEETGIMGSSLGGLSALYLGWKYPATFGLVGALSPSIWWAGKQIVDMIAEDPASKGPSKIWLDIGTRESDQDDNQNGICDAVEDTRDMGNVFLRKGYAFGKELFYFEDPGATHNEWSWSQRVDKALTALYGREQEQ